MYEQFELWAAASPTRFAKPRAEASTIDLIFRYCYKVVFFVLVGVNDNDFVEFNLAAKTHVYKLFK